MKAQPPAATLGNTPLLFKEGWRAAPGWLPRLLLFVFFFPLPAFPQSIAYQLSMPEPASHLFVVNMTIPTTAASLDLQMPRWQPGRYSLADFAKNVQEFSSPFPFEKIDGQTWRIYTRGHLSVSVAYKVFGNDLSGTYAQLDLTHANYNGGEIFMYVVGRKRNAVALRINPPRNWRIVNGSTDRPGQTEWTFPNYEILIDNPTEIGPSWTMDSFTVDGKTYYVMVHSRGEEGGLRPELVLGLEKVVRAHVRMWGSPDFDAYTFLIHYAADDRSGDGMEHLTSTQIINSGTLTDFGALDRTLETASHEFFHVWNVKRLRPVELGPWDWTRPVNTRSLWIVEGITEYYGNLMMRRAGFWDDARMLQALSYVIGESENSPGARLMSPVDASLAAPFIDSARHAQATNLGNTSFIYYFSGELVGLVLDLTIRARTNGVRSLDDVMKWMYEEFYVQSPSASYYLKGRGYTEEDFVRVLSEVAGVDMWGFYERHIRGRERLPYEEAFAAVGLRLARTPSSDYSAGIELDAADRQNLRIGALPTGSPGERAGLQAGDILLAIGGSAVTRGDWRSVLNRYRPGQTVTIRVQRFRRPINVSIMIAPVNVFDYYIEEIPGAAPAAKALRAEWLQGK